MLNELWKNISLKVKAVLLNLDYSVSFFSAGIYVPTCFDFLFSLHSAPSDMLLLWARPLLALLCLLPASALLHQHAHHVHHLPRPELRRLLPHAVPHRLRARPGKCELPNTFCSLHLNRICQGKQYNLVICREYFLEWWQWLWIVWLKGFDILLCPIRSSLSHNNQCGMMTSRIHSELHKQVKFLHVGFLECLKSTNLHRQIQAR